MSLLALVLIVASVMLGMGLLAVLAWLASTSYLNRVERRLSRRKGLYRDLVAELAVRERGKTGWEKFARLGFREGVVAAHG